MKVIFLDYSDVRSACGTELFRILLIPYGQYSFFCTPFLIRVFAGGQEYVRAVRQKLKERGVEQPKIKEFMAQAPGMVK